EGFVRIERIEHLPRKKVEGIVADALVAFGPVATLWCHGVPGPIVMRGTDVRILRDVSTGRVEHETSTPWWPQSDEVLLRDAVVTRSEPRVDVPQSEDSVIDYESADAVSQRARPPATWFGKPAVGLLVGDYVGGHRNRWPESDREADEGFVRVEHLRVLDPHIAQAVFADPSWHTTVIVAHLHGLHGVLVLRGDDEVPVLAFVNPEREAWDRRGPWEHEVTFSLRGSRWSTEEEHQHAVHIDAAHRPSVAGHKVVDACAVTMRPFRDGWSDTVNTSSEHVHKRMANGSLHARAAQAGDAVTRPRSGEPAISGARL